MKRLVALSAVLIGLVAIAWGTGMFGGAASTVELPTLGIEVDQISRIDVRSGESHVRAIRLDSGEWQIDSPLQAKADTTTVMRLIRQAADLELESIVSTNPERFGRFQVDSSGNELTLEWGDRRLDLIVGKTGPDFQSRYVRLDGDNRVLLANGVPSLSAKLDQWRDKSLWSFPVDAISTISVTNEDATYGVARDGAGWTVNVGAGSLAVDSAEVVRFVGGLSPLRVDGYLTELTADSVLAGVTHQLRIELADGTTETLLMSKRTSDVAALREGSAEVLKFFSYRLANLTPPLDKVTVTAE